MIGVRAGEASSAVGAMLGHCAPRRQRSPVGRVVLLVITALSLYLLAPRIGEVFAAWNRLGRVHVLWMIPAVFGAISSFACIWVVQAIALGSRNWFAIVTTQLAGNSFNRITPGGGATGTALQATMLTSAGIDAARAGTADRDAVSTQHYDTHRLTAVQYPLRRRRNSDPERPPLHRLDRHSRVRAHGRARPCGLGVRCAVALARSTDHEAPMRDRSGTSVDHALGNRLLAGRDAILRDIGPRWKRAVGASVLRWFFEFGVIIATLYGLSVQPDPAHRGPRRRWGSWFRHRYPKPAV